ncbi:hypothetical protein DGG96_18855 [Legionella qingyii]|uniref:Uncharacterized protein n=1 Tax=Legionella qingyii TaxID=2184757 RepID=A0A317U145_9GAMM|nr:hypothetical protein [Legionella qingyii]PWY54100.1 hypothetical protein DGG96_18855 [Legionella qingyii]RUR19356.1 hypothetical protein ELY20_15965 [Legionella qingyii]RUR21714.1 hypothetical protein ELY16_15890 [Legionella qingyii]
MKTTETALAQIAVEWNKLKEMITRSQEKSFFKTRENLTAIDNFFNLIALKRQPMTIGELADALQVLEHLTITTTGSKKVSFADWLDNHRYRTSQNIGIQKKVQKESASEKKNVQYSIHENSSLFRLLVKTHDTLINHHELANLHAQGEIPCSEISYSQSELKESQALYDMETTTQQEEANDKSTIIDDLIRKGVTLYGAAIIPGAVLGHRERILQEAIQNFAGDKIDTPHSKANKLYHFGGQFLQGSLLKEFTNTTKLVEDDIQGLESGITVGHINWSKDSNDKIYATVNLKILTCSYADPLDMSSPQRLFVMGSDGISLIELNEDELEKPLMQCLSEVQGETENNIVPLAEINAKIEIVKNESGTGYMFQVSEFTTKYNTPQLVSTKAPEQMENIMFKPI